MLTTVASHLGGLGVRLAFRAGRGRVADRILIVEDEAKLAALLRDYLAQEDFEVTVMLPGTSGLEVCKDWARAEGRR